MAEKLEYEVVLQLEPEGGFSVFGQAGLLLNILKDCGHQPAGIQATALVARTTISASREQLPGNSASGASC